MYQSGLVQNFAYQGSPRPAGESVFTGVQNTALSRGTPVRLMVQLDDGRYGAQYDQTLVDQLYASGLSELLTDSIEAMESPDRHPGGVAAGHRLERAVGFLRLFV